ncbi:MAG TPA: putative Ig domain-containing protein, partial [Cellvibrio sp.]
MTTQRRRLLIEPLESRLLFSATGDIAVIDDGNSDVAYLLDAAENIDLVAIYGDHLPEVIIDSPLIEVINESAQPDEYSGFREIVFIDTSVANFEQLLDDILQHKDPNSVDIIQIDPIGDGLAQINSALLNYSNLTAIHLITHGKDGTVNLGSTTLGANNIQVYKDEFLGWQNALQDNADILIYGCNVAATKEELQLVEQFADLTQADVAASNDLTGHKSYGGNWELEVHQGDIESSIIVSEAMQEQWVGVLANVDHIFVDTGPYELGVSTFSNIGQSFTYDSTGATYGVNSVSFLIKKDVGAPNQTITVELRSSWNGSVLGSSTISSSALSSSQFEWKTFSFANVDLNDNQTYVIRISSTDSSGSVKFSYHQANQYINTSAYIQSGTPNASGWDMAFKVSGDNGINSSPTISNPIPDQSTAENSNFSFQFASNTFNDLDGDTLTYTATLSNNNALPSWLSFNAGTRTFSGVPDDADVGTISIKVVANDGRGGIVTDQFDLVVSNVNDNPYVNVPVPNQNATEDSAFSYTFPANTFGDDDVGASFTYTAELAGGGTLPAWLNFNSATRTFSGTPANGDVGTLSIKLIANDGAGGAASDTFDIVIANTNDAPTIANAIPNQTATENALFNYTFPINTFNDVDVGNTLTYIAQLSGGGALPAWLSFDGATRTFSGTPSNGDVGTITIEVRASDGTEIVSDFFDLVIQNVGSSNVVYETSGPSTDTQVISSGVPFFQSFYHDSPSATYTIDSIVLQLVKDPSASAQTITVTLLSGAYNGTVVGTATVSSASIGTTLAWKAFDFTDKVLT